MIPQPTLIVVTGPTAVGKTQISLELAKSLDTEIINADSRQFYKEMSIGTAVPSSNELASVTHHFIQSHSIQNPISAGDYEEMALKVISKLFETKNTCVLTGGSGLFIDAVLNGIDESMPKPNSEIRKKWEDLLQNEGIERLQNELKSKDPEYYQVVDLKNSHRLLRALEVIEQTGSKYSELRRGQSKTRPFKTIKICLERPREELYDRINRRVDLMVKEGLKEEALKLLPFKELKSMQTVGYSEYFSFFDGEISEEKAIELIKRNSRRYAKRQMTWFRRDEEYHWMSAKRPMKVINFVRDQLK